MIDGPVAERSESGRWRRGMVYVPESGDCEGHYVRVINPEVAMFKRGIRTERSDTGAITETTVVVLAVCVLVRCMDCYKSWSFLEEIEPPEDRMIHDGEIDDSGING